MKIEPRTELSRYPLTDRGLARGRDVTGLKGRVEQGWGGRRI